MNLTAKTMRYKFNTNEKRNKNGGLITIRSQSLFFEEGMFLSVGALNLIFPVSKMQSVKVKRTDGCTETAEAE